MTAIPAALHREIHAADIPFIATYLVKMKEGMSFEAFKKHQLDTHARLALALPGLRDYRLILLPPRDGAPQPVDAIAQVTFGSAAAYEAAMSSPQGQQAMADLPNMLDMSAVMVLTAASGDVYEARAATG